MRTEPLSVSNHCGSRGRVWVPITHPTKTLIRAWRSVVQIKHSESWHLSLVMRKSAFCICENKDADQLRGLKFKASSHLVWLYIPVCVGPGRKPRRPVFSQCGSFEYKGCANTQYMYIYLSVDVITSTVNS